MFAQGIEAVRPRRRAARFTRDPMQQAGVLQWAPLIRLTQEVYMNGQTDFTAKVEPEDFKNTLFLAMELSRSTWLVATFAPRLGDKISVHAIPGGDTKRLLELIGRLQAKLRGKGVRVRTVCCYEAGDALGGAIVTRMGRDRLRARSSGRLAAR